MPYEIVHTIGSTTYFLLFVLFLWASRVPRTNPGAGMWAVAMLCAFCARLAFLVFLGGGETPLAVTVYLALNVLEKLFLVLGLIRFFRLSVRPAFFVTLTVAVEGWLLACFIADVSPLVRAVGVALFNAICLSFAARATYSKRAEFQPVLMLVASATCVALVAHWMTFVIIDRLPGWFVHGFLLGTVLTAILYLCLLAAVLFSFQRRLELAESKALDMAFQDPLTGLNNQRYMTTLFDKVLLLATRPHQLVAIFYIDLDNFKPINDKAGHAAGDEVLKTVASRLKSVTRSTDICARVGGDEFVVICTQLEQADQAEDVAAKLLAEVTSPIVLAGHSHILGASIGISLYPTHGNSLPLLLEHADSAMYEVKHTSKNGYQMYVPFK